MRNEKWEWEWEMRIELWINKKNNFLLICETNIWKLTITGLIGKKYCKKQKKIILKKKLLKEAIKEKAKECYKNLSQEKKTRLKSIKKKVSRISSV